jgi:predicted kinase
MCGLPATGKTHIANRIVRYLSFFLDIPAKIFNVGDYRRKLHGAQLPANFFDHSNEEFMAKRLQACDMALHDLIDFMKQDGVRVGVLDSTNSNHSRRAHIRDTLKSLECKVVVLESIIDKEDVLESNIRNIHLNTPDYKGIDAAAALKDFQKRRENYLDVYEHVDYKDGSHIKIINNETFVVYNVRGYLSQKVVHFVMNLHLLPREFYLSRHGQSEYNLVGKIGGDSGLTEAGLEYARRLADFAKDVVAKKLVVDEVTGEEKSEVRPARLWTSTLRRTKETAQFIKQESVTFKWDNNDEGNRLGSYQRCLASFL